MRPIFSLIAVCLLVSTASAQLFPNARWNAAKQTGSASGCPGGVCPTGIAAAASTRGHWSFPGTIENHLESTHGVATAGMGRQEKLNLHDSLHEGRYPSSTQRSVRTATRTRYGSSGSPVSYGSAGGLVVGSVLSDGAVVTSIGVAPQAIVMRPTAAPVLAASNDVAINLAFVETAEPGFRGELRSAIREARKAKTIDARTAFRLQTATTSPAFVNAVQDLAVTQMVFSGENTEKIPRDADGKVDVAGINWAELGKFLQLILPLILELFKGFGL